MDSPLHLRQALAQVAELHGRAIAGQRFRGYSGPARILSGVAALIGTVVLASPLTPADPTRHLLGWLAVLAVAAVLNYGALARWFLYDPLVERDWRRLRPALVAMPVLLVAGVLSVVLWRVGQQQLLFGLWMTHYGLANLATRPHLPPAIGWLGAVYVAAGVGCLLAPGAGLLNPWPMGLVFGCGELAGGLILQADRTRRVNL
jgi:hypothetical protein